MEMRKCPNGHYFNKELATCPYCKGNGANQTSHKNNPSAGTKILPVENITTDAVNTSSTDINPDEMSSNGGQVNPRHGDTVFGNGDGGGARSSVSPSNGTVFGDDTITPTPSQNPDKQQPGFRTTRKFVGWLVSYTLDPMGVDFKIYEGRNMIGRSMECNISINDNMVSSEHALLLFRAGKYSITDRQSTHGTFVNDRDIDLEPFYLQDGDEIRMGKTILKFKSSL